MALPTDIELPSWGVQLPVPPGTTDLSTLSEEYRWSDTEANSARDVLINHGQWLEHVRSTANMQWSAGYKGLRCWYPDGSGKPVDYYRSQTATEAEGMATTPGTNSAIWVPLDPTDPDLSTMTFTA